MRRSLVIIDNMRCSDKDVPPPPPPVASEPNASSTPILQATIINDKQSLEPSALDTTLSHPPPENQPTSSAASHSEQMPVKYVDDNCTLNNALQRSNNIGSEAY